MKPTPPLTEAIGNDTTKSIATPESNARPGPAEAAAESTPHSVTISIVCSGGYNDTDSFSIADRKKANAFARRLMSMALRAFARDEEAE